LRILVRKRRKKKQKCRRYQEIKCLHRALVYNLVQGLDSAPDVPHADNVSGRKTEGNGVGFIKEPPVSVKGLEISVSSVGGGTTRVGGVAASNGVSHIAFDVSLVGQQQVKWETLLIGKTLFIEIPAGDLPEGSKESFVQVLEYAEETLGCSKVIVCFKKTREDRETLIRTFMFLGFVLVAPGTHQLAVSGDLMYLAYSIEPSDDESSGDESSSSDDLEDSE
jgi:ornithine decarboxylase antizyme 1